MSLAIERVFALYSQGQMHAALAAAQPLLADPDPSLLNLTAECHLRLGQEQLAETLWQQALTLDPDNAHALERLGILLAQQQRPHEAEACFRRLIALAPHDADACNNLGNLLQEQQRHTEAIAAYRQATQQNPNHVLAFYNLSVILHALKNLEPAEQACRHALRLQPDMAEAHVNLCHILSRQERHSEALECCQAALRLDPNNADTHNLSGNLHARQKRFREAEAAYRHALRLQPGHADASWNLGLLLLSLGRLQEGWPLYEYRYHPQRQDRQVIPHPWPFPQWQGEDLTNQSLLVVCEQGFGDAIQFCRYLPLLPAGRLTLLCHAALEPLLATLPGVDHITHRIDQVTRHDFWTFLLSIPRHINTIPAPAMLTPDPERIAHWRAHLPGNGFRVGLVWRGSPANGVDADRSLPGLPLLAPLWQVPDITFISLQKGHGEEEAAHPPPGLPLHPLGHRLQDFADTAAVVAQLDLVIGVDTAVVHLAGTLGTPCWILLPWQADWRWRQTGATSPWYPHGTRLFRQPAPHAWGEVIREVTQALLFTRSANGPAREP
ncbi:MAG: glycosyltransferase family protein [Magnetococcales bacterium]|nr:glycosyltransferase family protein [Magnetococcales bacterium]